MKNKIFASFLISITVLFMLGASAKTAPTPSLKNEDKLAERVLPLNNRYAVESVNEVFKGNILLTLNYLSGDVKNSNDIKWSEVSKDMRHEIVLQPGAVFAFHDDVSIKYQGKKVTSTNAHFNAQEGFLSSGYLYGDGVCHLASIINWAAKDAGLSVEAPVKHDFANIPDVPREYGTSIYTAPLTHSTNQMQNLYIENNLTKPVKFVFDYSQDKLVVSVYKG